ncbi:MAG: asparagine synthase (glutamine-hydrolyzing) [Clostridia bacterium]|nr:asparagine synthase (glutamine-hydrolyzing) [Clostridia bacterium]
MDNFCGYLTKDKEIDETNIKNMYIALNPTFNDSNIFKRSNFTVAGDILTLEYDNYTYTIAFNGELYNKDEIIIKTSEVKSPLNVTSDAEAVLACYLTYADDCVDYLDGAYSFVIYDSRTNNVFMARDRLGLKPLYYTNTGNSFCFASKIKALLKHSDIAAIIGKDELCEIFGLGPAHTPGKTYFKNIYEIKPGHYGVLDNNELILVKYWDLETNKNTDSIEQAINKIKEIVSASLKTQLPTDTKVCSMLSGGLDSSVLTMLANKEIPKLNTYSINFENNDKDFSANSYQPTKDSDYVQIMLENLEVNHTNITFNNKDLFDTLKASMIARDMPGMADIDSSMLVFCDKIAKNDEVICISGECSDEIFGGYPWYYKEDLINSASFPWSRSFDTRCNILNNKLVSSDELKKYIKKAYDDTISNVVFNSLDAKENLFRATCYLTTKWFMNTLIERTDRMSSLCNLTVRVPFANYKLFEYVYNLPYKYKLGLVNGNNIPIEKYLLRKAFEDELPNSIVYRKKSPFPKTYDPVYLELVENEIKRIINSSTEPILEIINVKYLYELLETKGDSLKENWFGQLMTYPQTLAYLIQINMWLKEYDIDIEL